MARSDLGADVLMCWCLAVTNRASILGPGLCEFRSPSGLLAVVAMDGRFSGDQFLSLVNSSSAMLFRPRPTIPIACAWNRIPSFPPDRGGGLFFEKAVRGIPCALVL